MLREQLFRAGGLAGRRILAPQPLHGLEERFPVLQLGVTRQRRLQAARLVVLRVGMKHDEVQIIHQRARAVACCAARGAAREQRRGQQLLVILRNRRPLQVLQRVFVFACKLVRDARPDSRRRFLARVVGLLQDVLVAADRFAPEPLPCVQFSLVQHRVFVGNTRQPAERLQRLHQPVQPVVRGANLGVAGRLVHDGEHAGGRHFNQPQLRQRNARLEGAAGIRLLDDPKHILVPAKQPHVEIAARGLDHERTEPRRAPGLRADRRSGGQQQRERQPAAHDAWCPSVVHVPVSSFDNR